MRSKDPLFSISTDIIVGFPGETIEEFEQTAAAMQEMDFDYAFIARYSTRNGTTASKLEDDVSASEKARRWSILNDILRESVAKRLKMMMGREEVVLITGMGKDDTLVGRTRNFKEVYIPRSPEITIGSSVRAKIVGMDEWVLRGEVM